MIRSWARRVRTDRVFEDLLRSLVLVGDPAGLRASLARRVQELTAADAVDIYGYKSGENEFSQVHSTRPSPNGSHARFAGNGTLARWLRVNEEPLLVPHPDGAFDFLEATEKAQLTSRAVKACVPLIGGNALIGIMLIVREGHRPIDDEEHRALTRVARPAGLAIQNAEFHHQERERLRTLHRAQQLAIAGELAATVAHELKNPLTSIRSTVQYVLQNRLPTDQQDELLSELLTEIDRIDRTVSEVLSLSRPPQPELGEVDVVRIASQSLLLIDVHARARGISVSRALDGDPLLVMGDARELHQLFLNLLLNACQAMADGGALRLTSTISDDARHRRCAVLRVEDTGCGIPDADLARIFDPFFTTKESGTGLGLSICMDIVSRHDGTIDVSSTVGVGTVVQVLIPLFER